jgi:hypothetical protein
VQRGKPVVRVPGGLVAQLVRINPEGAIEDRLEFAGEFGPAPGTGGGGELAEVEVLRRASVLPGASGGEEAGMVVVVLAAGAAVGCCATAG